MLTRIYGSRASMLIRNLLASANKPPALLGISMPPSTSIYLGLEAIYGVAKVVKVVEVCYKTNSKPGFVALMHIGSGVLSD